jgi:hypothetical protein
VSRDPHNGSARHSDDSYAESLEGLGGQPWRTLEGTEQWFLLDDPNEEPLPLPAPPAPAPSPSIDRARPPSVVVDLEAGMDTEQFKIPSKRIWQTTGGQSLIAGLIAIGVVAALAAASSARPMVAPPPIVIVQAAPPVVIPAPPAPAPPPPPQRPAVAAPVAAPAPAVTKKPIKRNPARRRRRR